MAWSLNNKACFSLFYNGRGRKARAPDKFVPYTMAVYMNADAYVRETHSKLSIRFTLPLTASERISAQSVRTPVSPLTIVPLIEGAILKCAPMMEGEWSAFAQVVDAYNILVHFAMVEETDAVNMVFAFAS